MIVGGRHQFFAKRELETIDYSIEETYEEEEFIDLNEAEEILRQLRKEKPEE